MVSLHLSCNWAGFAIGACYAATIPGEEAYGICSFNIVVYSGVLTCVLFVSLTSSVLKMPSVVEDFFTFPSEILLERYTKKELLQIAERFGVEVTSNDKKLRETLMNTVRSALYERGVLEVRAEVNPEESLTSPLFDADRNVKFSEMSLQEKQLCVDVEKLRAERDVCALREKELERDVEVKRLQQQLEMRKLELQFEKEREERQFQLRKLELEMTVKTVETPLSVPSNELVSAAPGFDVFKHMRMVPPFSEREVEKYFSHFERVAESHFYTW